MTTEPSSTPRRWGTWDAPGRDLQLAQWRAYLDAAGGNITRAARALGVSKRRGMALTKFHGLTDYAAALRRKTTGMVGRAVGRPRQER